MAYRGDDLDLRTPQGWTSNRDAGAEEQPNWLTRSTIYKGGRNDPLWVDDVVMACCNHAYDLAVAHRAPEVRLEHLINALTLNEAAAHVLEARGLSVGGARRDSGAAIANDIPMAGGAQMAPRRSEALDETLRLAADRAYPRRTPVTVDDLLHVLFDMRRDLPGAQLLHRHVVAWSGRNGSEARLDMRLEPLPHLSRQHAIPASWPRPAAATAPDYYSHPSREQSQSLELVRAPMANTVDGFQNTRIDSLERAVRDLGIDLADDRKTLQSLVVDLQRTASAQADDTGRFRGSLNQRLASLENTLSRSRDGQLPASVVDYFNAIERGLETKLAEMSSRPAEATLNPLVSQRLEAITAFASKIEALERTFQLILDRLTGLERKLGGIGEGKPIEIAAVAERLDGIEQMLDNRTAESGRTISFIGDRLRSLDDALSGRRTQIAQGLEQIERSLAAYAENTIGAAGMHERELTEVHEALLKLNANQQTLASSLDQWRLDSTGDLSVVNNRLKVIEDGNRRRAPVIEAMENQIATLYAMLSKREVRKSRFRHWLFGTDAWYSASYDTRRWRDREAEQETLAGVDGIAIAQSTSASSAPPSVRR